jgi:DNA-binding MarR family transcriptional regulator
MAGDAASTTTGSEVRRLLQELNVRQQRYQRSMATALGIDRTSLEVVYHLIVAGPSTPSELARATGLSTAVVTQVVQRLEGAGHVDRSRHAADGRKVVVTVRPATADQAARHIAPLLARMDALVDGLDDQARSTVTAFLADAAATYRETRPSRDD